MFMIGLYPDILYYQMHIREIDGFYTMSNVRHLYTAYLLNC